MSSAPGFIKSVGGGGKFTSTFIIDDIQYHFSGQFSPAVQPFESFEATVEYDSPGQLTSNRGFDGKVGTQDVQITLQNGAKITGQLNMPVSPASQVGGNGTWMQN
ncbi:hypothetical protein FGRMN_10296 [Fusarium graminum]|nr:hypothetical protein FGRMN_10296 [Fusarium graminum]